MNKSAVGKSLLRADKMWLIERHEELLEALKEAQEVIYATINGRSASLSITWHTIKDAIDKAEGRA